MLIVKVSPVLRLRTCKGVFDQVHIVRMGSLQNQFGRGFRPWRVAVNASRFVRPEYALGLYFHSDSPGPAEFLRICQIRSAPPKFDLRLLAFFDIEVDPDPIEKRSVLRPKRLGTTEEPAIVTFSVTNPKTHLASAAGPQTL